MSSYYCSGSQWSIKILCVHMLSSTLFSDFNAIPTNKNHQILSSPSVYRIGGLVYLPTWSMTNDDQLPAAANDAFFFQFVLVWRRCWIAKWEQNFCPSAMRPFLFFRFCREKWSHNNRTISWRDKLWRCDDAEADFVVNGWMTVLPHSHSSRVSETAWCLWLLEKK